MPRTKKRTPQRIVEDFLAVRGWKLVHKIYPANELTKEIFGLNGDGLKFEVVSEVTEA